MVIIALFILLMIVAGLGAIISLVWGFVGLADSYEIWQVVLCWGLFVVLTFVFVLCTLTVGEVFEMNTRQV